jgi:hypothetical protein
MGNPELRASHRYGYFQPAASTTLGAGDAVSVDTSGKLIATTKILWNSHHFVGICEDDWSSVVAQDEYGDAALYTTPTTSTLRRVLTGGVANLPIEATSGTAGDAVYLSTATQGSMTFTLTQPLAATGVVLVGKIEQDFASATSGDKQGVIIRPTFRASFETDMEFWLNNHVSHGLSCAWDSSSLVSYSSGAVYVGGEYLSVNYASAALGIACASHTTKCRIVLFYVNAAGTPAIKDAGSAGPVFTTGSFSPANCTSCVRNSKLWPTFSYSEGVIFGAGLVRSASSIFTANRVRPVRRTVRDVAYRRSIAGNPIA